MLFQKTGNKVDSSRIVNLFNSGLTVAEIAEKFSISKKCAQQIVEKHAGPAEPQVLPPPKKRGVPKFPQVYSRLLSNRYLKNSYYIKFTIAL